MLSESQLQGQLDNHNHFDRFDSCFLFRGIWEAIAQGVIPVVLMIDGEVDWHLVFDRYGDTRKHLTTERAVCQWAEFGLYDRRVFRGISCQSRHVS